VQLRGGMWVGTGASGGHLSGLTDELIRQRLHHVAATPPKVHEMRECAGKQGLVWAICACGVGGLPKPRSGPSPEARRRTTLTRAGEPIRRLDREEDRVAQAGPAAHGSMT
jgi:hypothetical protein